ncbi:MAG: NYN domain-containing protein [Candidatus Accumulibacter sp.]|nr:NYN domain-containing protein [Accumulibacter sp.]
MKEDFSTNNETRVALLVDCDNVSPNILEYALLMAAQFGRIVLRRGYGNHGTLANKWQEALVHQAFTPCLQYQYASGKNTADIALALEAQEAMFDGRADTFCLVTSDSDFACLCRKLRERGAMVCIVGGSKTPPALRNACDQFFEWMPEALDKETPEAPKAAKPEKSGKLPASTPVKPAAPINKSQPHFVTQAVAQLVSNSPEGKITLNALGQYLKRTDSTFSPKTHGHSSLLNMIKNYASLVVKVEEGVHLVQLSSKPATTKTKKTTSESA